MNPIQNALTGPTSGSIRDVGSAGVRGGASGAGASATPKTGGPLQSADTVSISESARQLNAAAANSTAAASGAHVAALKSALAAGVYTVDPKKVAQGLLRDSRALQKASGG